MFSSRLPPRLAVNALGEAVSRARQSRRVLLDLTETNPTRVGLSYPEGVLSSLADPASLSYDPDPLGLAAARAVVAADYGRRGHAVDPAHILLTASTSEAYAMLFKLLCSPGDAVAIPQPSYPLFELLTRLEGVETLPYRLDAHGGWSIDRASLEDALTPRTRAVLVVSPNNPTGSMLRGGDRAWLVRLCAAHGFALIVDEVFAEYPLRPRPDVAPLVTSDEALTFSLGGLSKSAGLPQMKLAWTIVSGPAALRDEAMSRLELIADTYLSVSTPVQVALPALLEAGVTIREAILTRIRRNLAALEAAIADRPAVGLVPPDGGWSVALRVPATQTEDRMVIDLLDRDGVLVHPGYFYDFDQGAHLVISLLPEPAVFDQAIARVLDSASGVVA
jgi:aspartate/methionine/tyrosine aminotransferase